MAQGDERVKAFDAKLIEVERERLKLVADRLALDRERFADRKDKQKKRRLDSTGISIIVSTVLALITLFYNSKQQRLLEEETARHAFQLKAAEIVMSTDSPESTRNKAEVLQKLFPQELDREFSAKVKIPPHECPQLDGAAEAKEALIKLLAEHPSQRDQIIRDWSAVFTDQWAQYLKSSNPCLKTN